MAWKRRCGESARRAWTIALCVVTSIVAAEVGLGLRIEAGEQARRVFFVESFPPTLPAALRMNLPREIAGVTRELDWSKTLELAAHLQPNARNVVIISGASQFDKEWEEDTLQKLQPHLGRYHTRKLSGLPFDQLVNEVSLLTRDTIGLLLTVLVDGSGERRVPAEVSAALAKASELLPVPRTHGLGVMIGLEVADGTTQFQPGVQARGRAVGAGAQGVGCAGCADLDLHQNMLRNWVRDFASDPARRFLARVR